MIHHYPRFNSHGFWDVAYDRPYRRAIVPVLVSIRSAESAQHEADRLNAEQASRVEVVYGDASLRGVRYCEPDPFL